MTTLTLNQGGFMDQQATVANTTLKNKPLNKEEVEKVFNEESNVVAHHGQKNPDGMTMLSDKAKKIWATPHLRAGILIGAAAMATAVYVMLPDGSDTVQQIEGRDGVTAVEVTTETGEVNQDQAEYLARKQREEMEAKAASGETNAAVLATPTLIGETTEGSISSNTNSASDADATSSSSVVTGLRIAGEVVDGNPRFNRIDISEGVFYQDLNTGQYYKLTPDGRALVPSLAPGASPEAASSNTIPEHAMANAQQTQGVNVGGGDGGGTGGTGGPVEPTVPFNAEEDPDASRFRQKFASNYDAFMAQNQSIEQANSQYQQQMLQDQQMLMQQRQSLIQSSLSNAIGRVNSLTSSGSTFAPRAYSISSQGANGASGVVGGVGANGSGISSQGQGGVFGTTNYGFSAGDDTAGAGISGGSSVTAAADDSVKTPQWTTNATSSATGNQRLGGTAALPSHIVRAGTTYTVVVTKTVNSDYGNVVEARVVGGPFGGSTVYGQLAPQGRNAGIMFSGLQRNNVRSPIIPLNARAVSLDGKNGVAQVENHYLQNYTHMALTSALQGYGDAYANTGATTTVERSDGTVITTSDGENTRREVEANIARELSQRLQQDTAHLGNRPPTYIVPAGTVVQMRFSQDWDTTQVTNSIPQ